MGYHPDLSRIPIEDYAAILKRQNLLPARRMLLDGIDAHFAALRAQDIASLAQLRQALSTPKKLGSLAQASGIPENYLTMLRRELGSLEQKPVLLSDFPDIDPALLSTLGAEGIRTSRDLWERNPAVPAELTGLCDLVRINGVGARAAKAFYAAGFCAARDVAAANAVDMLRRVSAVNAQQGYYQAKLGEKDMQFCIDAAKLLLRFCE